VEYLNVSGWLWTWAISKAWTLVPEAGKLSNKLMEDFLDFTRFEQGKKNVISKNNYCPLK